MTAPAILGIAGWKNSGKTTLVVRLVEEFSRRGLKVATIKHAHHAFDVDPGETDSARHRRAGAHQVAIVSDVRWALLTELRGAEAPRLADLLQRLDPVDLVVVEGFKTEPIPKLEVRRMASSGGPALADTDARVIAIAADHVIERAPRPVFGLDDIAGIARFIEQSIGPLSHHRDHHR